MNQQLWGYKVEEKLYLGVREQKRLNTTSLMYSTVLVFGWKDKGKLHQRETSQTGGPAWCLVTVINLSTQYFNIMVYKILPVCYFFYNCTKQYKLKQ
jgi:hypothetical protein